MNYNDLLCQTCLDSGTPYRVMSTCGYSAPAAPVYVQLAPPQTQSMCVEICERFLTSGVSCVCGCSVAGRGVPAISLGDVMAASLRYSASVTYCDCNGQQHTLTNTADTPFCLSPCVDYPCAYLTARLCGQPSVECCGCEIIVRATLCIVPCGVQTA